MTSATSHRVVVVDDDPDLRTLVREVLAREPGMELVGEAADGYEALEVVDNTRPDVVVMDVDMPFLNGPRTTERIVKLNPATRVLAYTGHNEGDVVVRMIVAGAVGFALKGDPDELVSAIRQAATRSARIDPAAMPGLFDTLVEMARREQQRRLELERLATSLEGFLDDTIRALAAALHSRDGYTGAHDDRVADLCSRVGRRMGLEGRRLRDLRLAGILHDIGKIGIPDNILHKERDLSDEEWSLVRQHTIFGERILQPVADLQPVAKIVRHSHEYWNGNGYPDRLKGEEIPLESRIVLACDAFDAITTERTYQRAHSTAEAIAILERLAGDHFDPEVVNVLLDVVGEDEELAHGSQHGEGSE